MGGYFSGLLFFFCFLFCFFVSLFLCFFVSSLRLDMNMTNPKWNLKHNDLLISILVTTTPFHRASPRFRCFFCWNKLIIYHPPPLMNAKSLNFLLLFLSIVIYLELPDQFVIPISCLQRDFHVASSSFVSQFFFIELWEARLFSFSLSCFSPCLHFFH